MHAQWVRSSVALPHEGQSVEFVLDDRYMGLAGTYARQSFQSRWTQYGVERVSAWRERKRAFAAAPTRVARAMPADAGMSAGESPCTR